MRLFWLSGLVNKLSLGPKRLRKTLSLLLGFCSLFAASISSASALPGGEYLLTVTRPGSTLNIIDVAADKLVKQCDLGVGPGSGTLVVSPDAKVAYVLGNYFSDVYGVELDSCDVIFSTRQSEGNIRVKSIGSLTLSPDGKTLYTHQNRVRLERDHYEVLDSTIAAFDTQAGLDTLAHKVFTSPRQITILDRLETGELILGGQDVFLMNPETGTYETLLESLSLKDPAFAPRDVLTVWPLSSINNEFIRLFSTAKWGDEPGNLETADWLWGYESVDLATGEAKSTIFGPLEVALFSGARRPHHPNEMYGVLNFLKVYDIESATEIRSTPVDHSYYTLNFSKSGDKLYLLGADADIGVFDPDSLEKLGVIPLPGDGSLANSVVIER